MKKPMEFSIGFNTVISCWEQPLSHHLSNFMGLPMIPLSHKKWSGVGYKLHSCLQASFQRPSGAAANAVSQFKSSHWRRSRVLLASWRSEVATVPLGGIGLDDWPPSVRVYMYVYIYICICICICIYIYIHI